MAVVVNLSDRNTSSGPVLTLLVDPDAIQGKSSVFGPGIAIRLDLPPGAQGLGAGAVLLLGGQLRCQGEHYGALIPLQVIAPPDYLNVPLTDDQLFRIEARRKADRAHFELCLRGQLTIANEVVRDVQSDVSYNPRLDVPQDRWMDVLLGMDFGKRQLVELPPPSPARAQQLELVGKHIALAASRLAINDLDGGDRDCRIAIETLVEAIGEWAQRPRGKGDGAFKNYAEAVVKSLEGLHTPKSAEVYEVVAKAVQLSLAIFQSTSDSAHARSLGEVTRPETALLVGLAVSLYSFCVQLPIPEPHTSSSSTRRRTAATGR